MPALFYFAVAAMLAAYVVLDGFDLGAGILLLFVARNDRERREVRAAIGPFWDGNEVWLLAAGGLLFLAFPRAYAVGFSGFYLPLMLALWLLLGRGLSMELRGQVEHPLWAQLCDAGLFVSSGLLALVLGAALGNVLRGVPIDSTGWFHVGLFAREPGELGALDGYTVLVGLYAVALLTLHGALFLRWKCAGPLQERARRAAWLALPLVLALGLAATMAGARVRPELFARLLRPSLLWLPVLLSGAALILFLRARRDRAAFLASCALIASKLAGAALASYPVLLRSTIDPQLSIDALRDAASPHGLHVALAWGALGLPLAALYFAILFRLHRGKAELDTYE